MLPARAPGGQRLGLAGAVTGCHGPDQEKRKAGLRLDVRSEAVKPTKSGAVAIIAGHSEQSEIIKRLTSSDPDEKMPPAKAKKTSGTRSELFGRIRNIVKTRPPQWNDLLQIHSRNRDRW